MSIDPEERPRRKKKKRKKQGNTALIVGIVGGVLLLAVGAIGVAVIMKGKKDDSQVKTKPPPPIQQQDPPRFEPKQKKGKGLISAIARRMEVSDGNNWFRQLGIAYQTASLDSSNGQGPLKFEQLGPNFASTPLKEWYDKEWIKIVWGVRILNVQNKSDTALAWETDADSVGNRIVLMCDGSVQFIHESIFATTAKAMGR